VSTPGLGSRFDHRAVEPRWQAAWDEAGLATPRPDPSAPARSIVLPPPNVTGILTLGHMLGGTVMDVLARAWRMQGASVLWVPGLDHAGLATQVEVRRRLAKEGIRLESLPRDEIVARVEAWKVEHERRIIAQLKAAGFTLDWSRYRYTMDLAAQRATRDVFVRLYDAGLIYRAERMVNWDPRLRTALSDLEVVHADEPAELLYLEYRLADGASLEVATVRPETIFGDVAVAVHPDDERHRALVGKSVQVPLTDRWVPVITDAAIDPAFGNGALKVTPRHDPVDLEVFRRHPELAMPLEIFDDGAVLTGDAVPDAFRGLPREKARAAVTDALAAAGLLARREPYHHAVARSERSDAVIEPRLSTQWFVRITPLVAPAVDDVRAGRTRLHPDRWELTFYRWMEALDDWCISRQVAWGHAIPVYYCDACGRSLAAREVPAACPHCGSSPLRPDPDVLDTWFTSWLWPFVSLGWPEATGDLARFYPTTALVTGRDIMFFWVARMMMAGQRFTGRAPFAHVYFTGMLRDDQGRRMSKHLGNSPDPLTVIGERGADALRFALLFPNPVDQDGPFGTATLDGARNFLTKVWNLGRFATQTVPSAAGAPPTPTAIAERPVADRWILSRWRAMSDELDAAIAGYEPSRAATLLHGFLWHEVADRYLEVAKDALQGREGAIAARSSRETFAFVLERSLRQLHPIAPHVTEELWHALPHDGELLARAAWPVASDVPRDPEAEVAMEALLSTVRAVRHVRAENKVPAADRPAAFVRPAGVVEAELLRAATPAIVRLAQVSALELLRAGVTPPGRTGRSVLPVGEVFVALPAAAPTESVSLARERERIAELLAKTESRLADPTFRDRAPPDVVRTAEEKRRELTERLARIDGHLAGAADPAVTP